MAGAIERREGSLRLYVRVQPRASRDELAGIAGDRLKIRLSAPPVEGAANAACRDFLAALLGVSRSAVRLVAGDKAREKTFEVAGDAAALEARVLAALGG